MNKMISFGSPNDRSIGQRGVGAVRSTFSKFAKSLFDSKPPVAKKMLLKDAIKGNQISFLREVGVNTITDILTGSVENSNSPLDIAMNDRTKSSGADTALFLLDNELSQIEGDSKKQTFLTEKLFDMTTSGKFDRRELDAIFETLSDTLSAASKIGLAEKLVDSFAKDEKSNDAKCARDIGRILKQVSSSSLETASGLSSDHLSSFISVVSENSSVGTLNRFLGDISSAGFEIDAAAVINRNLTKESVEDTSKKGMGSAKVSILKNYNSKTPMKINKQVIDSLKYRQEGVDRRLKKLSVDRQKSDQSPIIHEDYSTYSALSSKYSQVLNILNNI
jgi:hypothetical protein